VSEATIFSDRNIAFLGELNREKVDFMIVGLSAAILQGAPVDTRKVDLWFRDLSDPGLLKALRKVFGTYIPSIGENPPQFAGEAVKLFAIATHMPGLGTFEEESDRTLKVRLGRFKVRVLPLERIIVSKEAVFQEKDRLVLPILKDALVVISESGQLE